MEDYRTALAGIRELTRIVELMAKLRGDLNSQPVNIILTPEWVELRTRIVTILEEFPEAKNKMLEALVSTIQVLLQTKRLKIAPALPEAQTLVEEMTNFQVRISQAGHDSYGAWWREGSHDDLLLAVALACWAAEKKLLPQGLHWPRVSTGRNL